MNTTFWRNLGIVLVTTAMVAALLIWIWTGRWTGNLSAKILPIGVSTRNEDIRERLLPWTPQGSDGTNVLKFVVDDLRPEWGAAACSAYVDALETSRAERLQVVRMDFGGPHRTIDVTVGSYRDGLDPMIVTAEWIFDENDRLLDITVERRRLGL